MRAKHFGYVGLAIWAILCILAGWLMYYTPGYGPVRFNLSNTILCKKNGDEWMPVDSFNVGEVLYICSHVESNVQDLREQIQIRVYEGERETFEYPIYYDNIWISNGDVNIPLRVSLYSGNYTVEISSGRKIFSIIQVEIQG